MKIQKYTKSCLCRKRSMELRKSGSDTVSRNINQSKAFINDSNQQRNLDLGAKKSIDNVRFLFPNLTEILNELKIPNVKPIISQDVTLDDFISMNTAFFDLPTINLLEKRLLFGAYGMIHQYFISSFNSSPITMVHIPFHAIWKTYVGIFNLINLPDFNFNEINEIQTAISNKNEWIQILNGDADEVLGGISLLIDNLNTLKDDQISVKSIDICLTALRNLINLLNKIPQNTEKVRELLIQLIEFRQKLKTFRIIQSLIKLIESINQLLSNSSFEINLNFLLKRDNQSDNSKIILKLILDYNRLFWKIMPTINTIEESRKIFQSLQSLYSLTETNESSFSLSSMPDIVQKYEETLKRMVNLSLNDKEILDKIETEIDLFPGQLKHSRIAFFNFKTEHDQIFTQLLNSQKVYQLYQLFLNFYTSMIDPTGTIRSLSYQLFQYYSELLSSYLLHGFLTGIKTIPAQLSNNSEPNQNTSLLAVLNSFSTTINQILVKCPFLLPKPIQKLLNKLRISLYFLTHFLIQIKPPELLNSLTISDFYPDLQMIIELPEWSEISDLFLKSSKKFDGQSNNPTESNPTSTFNQYNEPFIDDNHFFSEFDQPLFDSLTISSPFDKSPSKPLNEKEEDQSPDELFSSTLHSTVQALNTFEYLYNNDADTTFDFSISFYKFENLIKEYYSTKKAVKNAFTLLFNDTDLTVSLYSILEKTTKMYRNNFFKDFNVLLICYDLSLCIIYQNFSSREIIQKKYFDLIPFMNIPVFPMNFFSTLKYSVFFVTNEVDGSYHRTFCDLLLKYCSTLDISTILEAFQLYQSQILPQMRYFHGYDNIIDAYKQFNSFYQSIQKLNSYLNVLNYPTDFEIFDVILLDNMIQSLYLTFEKITKLKKDNEHDLSLLLDNIKDTFRDDVHQFRSYVSTFSIPFKSYQSIQLNIPDKFRFVFSKCTNPPAEQESGTLSFKMKNFFYHFLSSTINIKIVDLEKAIQKRFFVTTSFIPLYYHSCPPLKQLKPLFDELLDVVNSLNSPQFHSLLFRILDLWLQLNASLQEIHQKKSFDTSLIDALMAKIRSVFIDALNIVFLKKDLKIIIKTIECFVQKYQFTLHSIKCDTSIDDDYYSTKSVFCDALQKVDNILNDIYQSDLKDQNGKEIELTYKELYETVPELLTSLNTLFHPSITNFIMSYYEDGNKQLNLLSSQLAKMKNCISKEIQQEEQLIADQAAKLDLVKSNSDIGGYKSLSVFAMYEKLIYEEKQKSEQISKDMADLKERMNSLDSDISRHDGALKRIVKNHLSSQYNTLSSTLFEKLDNNETPSANQRKDPDLNASQTIAIKLNELQKQNSALQKYVKHRKFHKLVDNFLNSTEKFVEDDTEIKEIIDDPDDEYEYQYEYEYENDESDSDVYDKFENDEIKLIEMINELRSNGTTKKEIVSSEYKDAFDRIELEFYRLISQSNSLFRVQENEVPPNLEETSSTS